MTRWLTVPGILVGVALAAGAVVAGIGRSVWSRDTARAVAQLRSGTPAEGVAGEPAVSRARLDDLPPPVARYFAFALPEGQRAIGTVEIGWSGEFQSRPGGGWAPFEAVQYFTTRPPGFVWDARIRVLPVVWVRVRDGYHAGTGTMLGRIGAVVTVVDQGGTPEMARSALVRWLGEAVWFPTALFPGGTVRWEALDDSTARATVSDGEVRVSAEFHFVPGGEIARMTAMRYRDVDGTAVLTPFEGRYGAYERRSGVMVPAEAEVAWRLPEGRFPYWRGRPEIIVYGQLPAGEHPGAPAVEPDRPLPPEPG